MKITCTGRKVNLKDAFIQRVETKLAKLDKFFSDSAEANVTVTVEKDWQTVEVTVKDKGFTSRAEKSADRMEDAFDAAVDLLTRRIVKNRKRLENRVYQPAVEEFALAAHEAEPNPIVSINTRITTSTDSTRLIIKVPIASLTRSGWKNTF